MYGPSQLQDVQALGLLRRRLPDLQSLSLDCTCSSDAAAGVLEDALRCAERMHATAHASCDHAAP